jgi:hypothetical protein
MELNRHRMIFAVVMVGLLVGLFVVVVNVHRDDQAGCYVDHSGQSFCTCEKDRDGNFICVGPGE